MWNKPTEDELRRLPPLYATENTPLDEKVIHMHFFFGRNDWFVVEFDGEDIFFGFAILNNDFEYAEWGYFSLAELDSINFIGFRVDRDMYWKPVRIGDIEILRELL